MSDRERNADALVVLLWRARRGFHLRLLKLPRVVKARTGQANDGGYS